LNNKGWVMNPILNLQSLNPKDFKNIREWSTNRIICSEKITKVFENIFKEPPKIVQSMYFEGNSATWEHQDTYYLDSERIGTMAAAWIALEDIEVNAGRFFVCPKTHLLKLNKQNKANNVAYNHDVYIKQIVELMKKEKMPIIAPYLKKGDALFWNSRTIHGSLDTQDIQNSRSSITVHAIPSKDLFLQLQSRKIDIPTDKVNNAKIWRPKDQAKLKNRIILALESKFPGPFYTIKKTIINMMVK